MPQGANPAANNEGGTKTALPSPAPQASCSSHTSPASHDSHQHATPASATTVVSRKWKKQAKAIACPLLVQHAARNMEKRNPIKREEIIGKRVSCVFHRDLPYNEEKQFQERLIVVELESGLRFSLEQDSKILDPVSGVGFVYPFVEAAELIPVFKSADEPNLLSPVQTLILPYGWEYLCGLILENGFALHDGFSDWENAALFYRPEMRTRSSFVEFDLPS